MTGDVKPVGPTNLKGWLGLMAIYAVAGAVLGGPGHGPVSAEDSDWQKWGGIALHWFVMGGFIGVASSWFSGRKPFALRMGLFYALTLPVLMLIVEGLRLAAAKHTGGWETGVTSVAVAAAVGAATALPFTALFVAIGKAFPGAVPTPPK